MSGEGAPAERLLDARGLRVAVVATRWYAGVTDALVEGALRALRRCRVEEPTVVRVPGAFELPVVAKALAQQGHQAVVCLGLVLRGETPHFDYVCQAVTGGCTQVAVTTGVPVGFGVLTCDDEEQAVARSGVPGAREDKGAEAALAAVETALLLRELRLGGAHDADHASPRDSRR